MRRGLVGQWVWGAIVMAALTGCASGAGESYYGPGDRAYYAFEVGLDNSLPSATRISYRYGDLGEQNKPSAIANGGTFDHMRLEMAVPEQFEVSWVTPDGKQQHAVVPVRSRIKRSLKGKSVLFRILHSDVRGFVSTYTPTGEQLERFY